MAIDNSIQFFLPTRIHYESDSLANLASVIKKWGNRIVIVHTKSDISDPSLVYEIRATLERELNSIILYDDIEQQPDSDDLDSAAYFIRQTDCDVVVGLGGVESMHTAKMLSLLLTNDGFCSEYLSHTKVPQHLPVTCITMPLYPVYGTEVVPHIWLTDAEDRSKKMLTHEFLYPAMAYIDPVFSVGLQNELSTSTGLAILAAAVETLLARGSNDITNTLALKVIEMVAKTLPRLVSEPKAVNLRSTMSLSSILVGMAYANSFLGSSLALAMAINSFTGISEDILLSIMLPHVMEYNLTASPGKYVQIAKVLEGVDIKDITVIEAAIKAVEGVRKLYSEVNLPVRLSDLGLSKGDFTEFAMIASKYHFLQSTPRHLNKDEMETLLIAAF